ncbi:VOC family protein [Streptomyces himalayensis]|uniref:VOC family protein n=1 Tax=Streptomyces himalayensis subsp. himalayensis TaxID=2756131 RepID=A0A7W0DQM3_9ACTN|nr:VOC family protein [Streptomyces himalayensis]MBA2949411.1 VOC family protein [Streptomyces himalayensis subsp. himalayensis]
MQLSGLGYFGLRTRRTDEWRTFAEDVLGLQSRTTEDGLRLRVDDRDWRIALHQSDAEEFAYVGWELPGPAELDAAAAELEAAGVVVKRADEALLRERDVLGLVHLEDPNGIRVELFHGARTATTPFLSPTGARFVTGDQGLGHVVFNVDDFEATYRFYTELLGFRVSDFCDLGRKRIAFLHTNPRHHSLAFAGLVIDPQRKPKKDIDPGELFHFMLEVDDYDTVGYAYDRCLDGGAPIALTIGRHSNDKMLSFYAVTPSGFEVEYGYGAITVSDPWVATRVDGTSLWGHRRPPRPAQAAAEGAQA